MTPDLSYEVGRRERRRWAKIINGISTNKNKIKVDIQPKNWYTWPIVDKPQVQAHMKTQ